MLTGRKGPSTVEISSVTGGEIVGVGIVGSGALANPPKFAGAKFENDCSGAVRIVRSCSDNLGLKRRADGDT